MTPHPKARFYYVNTHLEFFWCCHHSCSFSSKMLMNCNYDAYGSRLDTAAILQHVNGVVVNDQNVLIFDSMGLCELGAHTADREHRDDDRLHDENVCG